MKLHLYVAILFIVTIPIGSLAIEQSETDLLIPPVSYIPEPGEPEKLGVPKVTIPNMYPTELEVACFEQLNLARANPGEFGYGTLPAVPALHWNAALLYIGRVHSQDMSDDGYFEHDTHDLIGGVPTLVQSWIDRVRSAYPFSRISENIAKTSQADARHVAQLWMDSPPHRKNIMDGELTEGSIGVYQGSTHTYWTHDFGGRTISYNLSISNLTLDPASPNPGDQVSPHFDVYSHGEIDAYPVEIIMYRGNPSAGGVAISNKLNLPIILVGGDSKSTGAPAIDTTGFPIGSELYVVLDPDNRFQETNESDNVVHVPLFGLQPPTATPTNTSPPVATATFTPIPPPTSTFTPTQTLLNTPTQTPSTAPNTPTPTPTTSLECVEVVRDGGFEGGPPHSDWPQTYQRYEVLYAEYEGSPPAYEGSYFCWFGGLTGGLDPGDFESASIQQSLTIPPGKADLSFYLRISSGLSSDYMRVLMDGNELVRYTAEDVSNYPEYTFLTGDASAYADGGSHVLRFESMVSGETSFYIDNISLQVCPQTQPTATPTTAPSNTPTVGTIGGLGRGLFEFCHDWRRAQHGPSDLIRLLGGGSGGPTPTATQTTSQPTSTPTATQSTIDPTPTPTDDLSTFDFKNFFPESAGSTWHYTGIRGSSSDDDFRWTVENSRQDVGGGMDAARFRTDTDEASDARNGDVDLWRIAPNGDVFFYGVIRANAEVLPFMTIPAQPIILSDPLLVGRNGLQIGDEVTDVGSGTLQVETPFGTQTLTGAFNSTVIYTKFEPTFETPLGTFTNVLRVIIVMELTVNVPVVGENTFEFVGSTFFLKKGVGMIAQDQEHDLSDAEIQAIDQGTVYVGGSPVTVTAN